MTLPASTVLTRTARLTSRRPERRQALGELLTVLARRLDRRNDISMLRRTFEDVLGRVLPVWSVHLREAAGPASPPQPASDQHVSLEVPSSDPTTHTVLEGMVDPAHRLGQWDYQMLGFAAHVGALVLEIERTRRLLARAGPVTTTRSQRDGAAPLIGSTPAMQALRATIERLAGTEFTVLLEGESGVGKELVARQIHDLSRRRHGPFVAVNCAALVETLLEAELFGIEERTATGVRGRRGKFEHADRGTLFLDEVSDLSLSAQAKLLRAIQDLSVERVGGHGTRKVDVRIIAATNRRLADLVERSLFRPDLFYRLSGVDVRVPTLGERRADILELATYFLERHRSTREMRLSAAAADALASYNWPGNVRELERLMERAITLAAHDVIELDDLPPAVRGDYAATLAPSLQRNDTMRAWGSRYARLVFERCHRNKRAACAALGISYHTLQAYLRYPFQDAPRHARRDRLTAKDRTGPDVAAGKEGGSHSGA